MEYIELKEVQPHGTHDYNFAVYARDFDDVSKISVHWHDEYEIIHVLDGEVSMLVNGETHVIRKNQALFIDAKAVHSQIVQEGDAIKVRYLCYVFGEKFMFPSTDTYIYKYLIGKIKNKDHTITQFIDGKEQYEREILKQLGQLAFVYDQKEHAIKIQVILLSIFDLIVENNAHYKKGDSHVKNNDMIIKALEVLNEKALEDLYIQDIANQLHINIDYFIKLFKKQVGVTPNRYLLELRLDKAKQMLVHEEASTISEISERCGFHDVNYFCRMFKKYHKKTASQIREEK